MAEPANTPMPPGTPLAGTPRSQSPVRHIASKLHHHSLSAAFPRHRPVVLHIGDPIKYNHETYAEFSRQFEVIRLAVEERQRDEFVRALKERRWGDFEAVFRPYWGTGGEMGKWDQELIDLLPASVKVFASAGAGFDWADIRLLGKRGIIYCNSGLAAAESVADFAVTMIISTFRHLPWCMGAATLPFYSQTSGRVDGAGSATESALETAFHHCHSAATTVSRNPRGHNLGIIGLGKIGQLVAAKMGHPVTFGMPIHYFDVVRQAPEIEERLGATFHPSLQSLLAVSDCVVLATPASPDGKPLITAETLQWFKPGGRFVNVARGSLVDDDALATALEAGNLSAAALDVHSDEPRISQRLIRLAGVGVADNPNNDSSQANFHHAGRVMLTCHNAGGTVDSHVGFEELSMRNIMAVLSGKDAITPVNLHYLK